MSVNGPVRGIRRGRSALAAAALATALTLTVAGCGPTEDEADGKPEASESQAPKDELKLPEGLPTSLEDLDKWKGGAWKDWDREDWMREAKDFVNPIIEDLWDPDRMWDAEEPERPVDEDVADDQGVTDPAPDAVPAAPVAAPYPTTAPAVGKIFFDAPEGPMVCSGTVVEDPENPGESNLVATAGHCVHKGKAGGWFRNLVFVPSYNPEGKSAKQLEAEQATEDQLAPHGVWWAEKAMTTDQWIAEGQTKGGAGAPYDFAVLKVKPKKGGGKSLEEMTGSALPIWFGAPKVDQIGALTAQGYPAAPPFDGQRAFGCEDTAGRLSVQADQPTMYRIGCTMTAGASGGGWTAERDGSPALVSVTSIGPLQPQWLAGPRLGKEARAPFDAVSKG